MSATINYLLSRLVVTGASPSITFVKAAANNDELTDTGRDLINSYISKNSGDDSTIYDDAFRAFLFPYFSTNTAAGIARACLLYSGITLSDLFQQSLIRLVGAIFKGYAVTASSDAATALLLRPIYANGVDYKSFILNDLIPIIRDDPNGYLVFSPLKKGGFELLYFTVLDGVSIANGVYVFEKRNSIQVVVDTNMNTVSKYLYDSDQNVFAIESWRNISPITPFIQIGGLRNGKYYDSFFKGQIAALLRVGVLEVYANIMLQEHTFPITQVTQTDCPTCEGRRKVQHGDEITSCRTCKGTGVVKIDSSRSYVITLSQLAALNSNADLIRHYRPDTESKESAQAALAAAKEDAYSALFIAKGKTYAESKESKIIERQDRDLFYSKVADHHFMLATWIAETAFALNEVSATIQVVRRTKFSEEDDAVLIDTYTKLLDTAEVDPLVVGICRDRVLKNMSLDDPIAAKKCYLYNALDLLRGGGDENTQQSISVGVLSISLLLSTALDAYIAQKGVDAFLAVSIEEFEAFFEVHKARAVDDDN